MTHISQDIIPTPAIPGPALFLGLGGLVPFVIPPLLSLAGEHGIAHQAFAVQTVYAAVILSFLGGVHWGRALAGDAYGPTWPRLVWAVLPSLIGWLLVFVPTVAMLAAGFAIAFALAFIIDLRSVKACMFPPWYGRLRKILTIGVLASMALTLFSSVVSVAG